MTIVPGNGQHIGSREEQQDSFAFSDIGDKKFAAHGGVLAVLADGMGGLANGRDASTITVRTVLKEYEAKTPSESVPEALARSVARANAAVNEMARSASMEGDVGTTLIAAVVHEGNLYWYSAGDSRIYLYRDGELSQVTMDHNYGLELDEKAAQCDISRETAANHPERGHLISFLGLPEIPLVDSNIKPFFLQKDDRILLCSDGLYGTLSEKEIAEEMAFQPQASAERLVEKTLGKNKRYQDNITVLISAYEPVTNKGKDRKKFPWKIAAVGLMLLLAIGSAGFFLGRNSSFTLPLIPHFGKTRQNMPPLNATITNKQGAKTNTPTKQPPASSSQKREEKKKTP